MGGFCCKEKQTEEDDKLAKGEEEIYFQSNYSSKTDQLLKQIEETYNYLCKIHFYSFMTELIKFNIKNPTKIEGEKSIEDFSEHQDALNEELGKDAFQVFIENRLLKNKEIADEAAKDESKTDLFKEVLLRLYTDLQKRIAESVHGKGTKELIEITKLNLIPFGFLFCRSPNIVKIKVFFDLFQKDGTFSKSDSLDKFLLSMFLSVSYCELLVRLQVDNSHSEILGHVDRDKMKGIIETNEIKDCVELVRVFNESFFDKDAITFNEFKLKFADSNNGFQWLFNPKGIRNQLEIHNV